MEFFVGLAVGVSGALITGAVAVLMIWPAARANTRAEHAAAAYSDYFKGLARSASGSNDVETLTLFLGAKARIATFADSATLDAVAAFPDHLTDAGAEGRLIEAIEAMRNHLGSGDVPRDRIAQVLFRSRGA